MLDRIVGVKAKEEFRLEVEFADGVRGVVDMGALVGRGVFAPLAEPAYFARVAIDDFGVLCWPNGADLAPDAMHDALASCGVWRPGAEPLAA
jgi:Protein of unknown function (DUF2442)